MTLYGLPGEKKGITDKTFDTFGTRMNVGFGFQNGNRLLEPIPISGLLGWSVVQPHSCPPRHRLIRCLTLVTTIFWPQNSLLDRLCDFTKNFRGGFKLDGVQPAPIFFSCERSEHAAEVVIPQISAHLCTVMSAARGGQQSLEKSFYFNHTV